MVRALGLEPSLVRGKSPVPYLLGVTRMVGRAGLRRSRLGVARRQVERAHDVVRVMRRSA